jgi:RHS repeat-associated protein
MTKVSNNSDGSSIFAPKDYTVKGQLRWWDNGAGDIIHNFNEYDQFGFPTNVLCGTSMGIWDIQNLETHFNTQTGNLEYRKDKNFTVTENFTYDNVHNNRLASWQVIGQPSSYTATYADNNGNILSKSDVTSAGNDYIYATANNKPHAVSSITNPLLTPAEAQQVITYNRFNKVEEIKHTNQGLRLNIYYGPDEQRIKSEFYINNVLNKTKYFIGGDYEVEKLPNGSERRIHYLPGGGIYVSNELGTGQMYYVQSDYQGNWSSVTDATGNVLEHYSFDPWGRRRNHTDWSFNNVPTTFLFDRGYTGHEMLDAFGLINMNGRVYDPVMARFLSPDNYVQAHNNSQGFNRYSYCLNNPLVYTDPDGNNPLVIAAIVIAATAGAQTGYKIAEAQGYNLGNWQTWGFMLGGAAIGGYSGFLGASIAAQGGFMANTYGLMLSSSINSFGLSELSGGNIQPSVSFGVASFNPGTHDWGYLGKSGNKWYENMGYGFGALANLSDMVSLLRGGGQNIDINSKHVPDEDGDIWGHSSATYESIENGKTKVNTLVSVGPENVVETTDASGNKLSISQIYKNSIKGADVDWHTYFGEKGTWTVRLNNVSTTAMSKYASGITRWDLLLNSCVGHTTRALWSAGVPTIYALHPHMLNFQLLIRQLGIYSSPYLYQIP